jgi:homoserine O-acetyltransferase
MAIRREILRWLALFLSLFVSSSIAAEFPTPIESDWIIRDFRFHTGETLPELRIHLTTIGAATGQPVLLLHGTNESAKNLLTPNFGGELFGEGQPLDARRYFIILPDAIGHGASSKPSDGLRTRFPHYNLDDVVAAQYRLLTDHLGIRHVTLVLGNSVGGMETWLWGETHPEFMDALMPLASEPAAMAGRNWMIRRFVIDSIRNDPTWAGGNYAAQPKALREALAIYGIIGNGGDLARYQRTPTRQQTDAEYNRLMAVNPLVDANDLLYQFESVADYDPARNLGRISARVVAVNSADDEKNPPELGLMEAAMSRLKNGKYVLLPITDRSRGHGTTVYALLWRDYLSELLSEMSLTR